MQNCGIELPSGENIADAHRTATIQFEFLDKEHKAGKKAGRVAMASFDILKKIEAGMKDTSCVRELGFIAKIKHLNNK